MKINNSEDIFFSLKMSIFHFFVKSGFDFYNKDRGIVFNLLTNDKNFNIQNEIFISITNNVFITTVINIEKVFMDIEELVIIGNYLNEFFGGIFSCYAQDNKKENSSLYLKTQVGINNTLIDNEFWEKQISINVNNVSSITDFLFFEYPKSKFLKSKEEIKSIEFKNFLLNSIKKYFEALKIIKEQENKEINKEINKYTKYLNWTKEQIEKEIDKELSNFSEKENEDTLNMLVDVLKMKM